MDWTKVVASPLGLAGYAMTLVFAVLSRKGGRVPAWWRPAALTLAVLCTLGGLGLAYLKLAGSKVNPPVVQHASATGTQSAAINVNGNGNVIGVAPNSQGAQSGAGALPQPDNADQNANARAGGEAINVNGAGNSVALKSQP
jgi:hypothetical protein